MSEHRPSWLQILSDFEIFRKIEIMRMVSFFQVGLRLSAHWTPELRIAAPDGWGMTLTEIEDLDKSRIEDCDPQTHGFVEFLKIISRPT